MQLELKAVLGSKHRSCYDSNKPTVIAEIGSGDPLLVINVGTHGNEYQSVIAVETFLKDFDPKKLDRGSVRFTLSNPVALRSNRRFLVTDLNRAYPGDLSAEGEKRIAAEVLPLVQDADFVLDCHTSPNPDPFIILGSRNQARLPLAELIPIEPIVLFEAPKPCAMVDFTPCGVGVELGQHSSSDSAKRGVETIQALIDRLGFTSNRVPATQHKYYEVFQPLNYQDIPPKALGELHDFQPILNRKLGLELEEDVSYPILCGKKDYTDNFCYLTKQVERDELK